MRATTGPSWHDKTFILQFLKPGKINIALFKGYFCLLFHISTGGPWTATPALIKIHEIRGGVAGGAGGAAAPPMFWDQCPSRDMILT